LVGRVLGVRHVSTDRSIPFPRASFGSFDPNRLSAAPSLRVRSARDMGVLPDANAEENDSPKAIQGALDVLKARDSSVSRVGDVRVRVHACMPASRSVAIQAGEVSTRAS
jgi:hypothetical protein